MCVQRWSSARRSRGASVVNVHYAGHVQKKKEKSEMEFRWNDSLKNCQCPEHQEGRTADRRTEWRTISRSSVQVFKSCWQETRTPAAEEVSHALSQPICQLRNTPLSMQSRFPGILGEMCCNTLKISRRAEREEPRRPRALDGSSSPAVLGCYAAEWEDEGDDLRQVKPRPAFSAQLV